MKYFYSYCERLKKKKKKHLLIVILCLTHYSRSMTTETHFNNGQKPISCGWFHENKKYDKTARRNYSIMQRYGNRQLSHLVLTRFENRLLCLQIIKRLTRQRHRVFFIHVEDISRWIVLLSSCYMSRRMILDTIRFNTIITGWCNGILSISVTRDRSQSSSITNKIITFLSVVLEGFLTNSLINK